jgi:hypothetical protein
MKYAVSTRVPGNSAYEKRQARHLKDTSVLAMDAVFTQCVALKE